MKIDERKNPNNVSRWCLTEIKYGLFVEIYSLITPENSDLITLITSGDTKNSNQVRHQSFKKLSLVLKKIRLRKKSGTG